MPRHIETINDREHDLINHPFKRRETYELHKIDALFTGFNEDTIELKIVSACSPMSIGAAVIKSRKLKRMIDDTLNKIIKAEKDPTDTGETILIRRLKGGIVQPIVADLHGGKGKKQRLARIEKRIAEVAKEYGESTGDKLVSIRSEK